VLEKLLNFFRKKKPIKQTPLQSIYHTSPLRKSNIFDQSFFENLPTYDKITYLKEMYFNSPTIFSAVREIIMGILSFDWIYYHPETTIQNRVLQTLNNLKIRNLLYDASEDLIVKGFTLIAIYKEDKIKFDRITYYNKIEDDLVYIGDKVYSLEDFIFVKLPSSPLVPLIPYYNIIKALEDSIYNNTLRFAIPYNILKTKHNISEEQRQMIEEDLRRFYSNEVKIPFLAYNENILDFSIEVPENILSDYIAVYNKIEEIIYKTLGLMPSLVFEKGGSYAKAKIHKDLFTSLTNFYLFLILDEILIKLIPKLFILWNRIDLVEEENYGYFKEIEEEE